MFVDKIRALLPLTHCLVCAAILFSVALPSFGHNAKAQQTYDEERAWIEQQLKNQKNFVNNVDPRALFNEYNATPPETTYYERESETLKQAGRDAAINSGAAEIILNAQAAMEHQTMPPEAKDYENNDGLTLAQRLNDPNAFCVEGDCSRPVREASSDFYKSVAMLSGAAEASQQLVNNGIFNGQPQFCRKVSFGIMNCCSDSGWAYDIHLTHCRSDEKTLGKAKESHRVVYVGEYCAHKKLGRDLCLMLSLRCLATVVSNSLGWSTHQ